MKRIKIAIMTLLYVIVFISFWFGFFLAENDAYSNNHGGFIHDPTGILIYVGSAILFFVLIPIQIWWLNK